MGVPPYVVHQTFQYGGVKGKRHRLREAVLWRDPPAYYRDGQFLHAELAFLPPPADFEDLPDFNMSLFHLQNMEFQLQQVRTGDDSTPV
jgi:arabinosyltransferase